MLDNNLVLPRAEIVERGIGSYEIDPYFLSVSGNRQVAIESTLSALRGQNPDFIFDPRPTKHGGVRITWKPKEQ